MQEKKKRRWWLPVDCLVKDCICNQNGECRASRITIDTAREVNCPYKSHEQHMKERPRQR